jgi:glyoxylase-like metal-dependent hydrolase (beta-lactamase superfamily II)
MKVGRIEIVPVIDGSIVSQLPANRPLPQPGSEPWQAQHGMFRPDGMIESATGGFLVRAGDRTALIDAGSGQAFPGGYTPPVVDPADDDDPIAGPMRAMGSPPEQVQRMVEHMARTMVVQGELPASLSAAGVRPEEVTDVIFTHLHYDHIGWASAEGSPFFPNATLHAPAADLDYFLPGPDEEAYTALVYGAMRAGDRLGPVLDRVETWEADRTILPGIDVRLAGGHTPGSSAVVVSDGNNRALLLGDIIHCPLELMDEDFNFLVDQDQKLADAVREAYARELEGSDIPVAASHFPGLRFGRLLPGEGTRRWTFDPA